MKLNITIEKAKDGHFTGLVSVDSIPIAYHDQLTAGLTDRDGSELRCEGLFEVEIDSVEDWIANAYVTELTIYGGQGAEVTFRPEHIGVDFGSVETVLDEKIDWSDWFQGYEAAKGDWDYECMKDRLAEEGRENGNDS